MEKIGLFFGSFNPVHKGHINIAKYVLSEQKLNKVLFKIGRASCRERV